MEESLESKWQKLSLSEVEKEEVVIEQGVWKDASLRGERCLIVTLLTSKYYNREAM